MAKPKARRVRPSEERPAFDAKVFLESAGAARRVVSYSKGRIVFSQGQPSDSVMYIQEGNIKISVLSRTGKEAVVAMLAAASVASSQPDPIWTLTAGWTFSFRAWVRASFAITTKGVARSKT